MLAVETVIQAAGVDAPGERPRLFRTANRVPDGTSIRMLLNQVGGADLVGRIANGDFGLARHGQRAWLDDVLREGDRVEVVAPIVADAKAARTARVAADRRRRAGQVGRR